MNDTLRDLLREELKALYADSLSLERGLIHKRREFNEAETAIRRCCNKLGTLKNLLAEYEIPHEDIQAEYREKYDRLKEETD